MMYMGEDPQTTAIEQAVADYMDAHPVEQPELDLATAALFVDSRFRRAMKKARPEIVKQIMPQLVIAGLIGGVVGALVARWRK